MAGPVASYFGADQNPVGELAKDPKLLPSSSQSGP